MSRTLLVGSISAAEGFQSAIEELRAQNAAYQPEMLDRILEGAAFLEPSSFASAVLLLGQPDFRKGNARLLQLVMAALAPRGIVEMRNAPMDDTAELSEMLHQAGFEAVHRSGPSILATAPVDSTHSRKRSAEDALLAAPTLISDHASSNASTAATSVPLRLRSKAQVSAAKKASLWALTREPPNVTTAPSIDESSLLTPEDLARREAVQRPDCDVKRTRRACKNCSCGLRELLLQEQDDLLSTSGESAKPVNGAPNGVELVSTGVLTSSCGSCYLGDAFRCSSCPYLGMPAFEPGEKVRLTIGDDV